jgi:hypothetical protein
MRTAGESFALMEIFVGKLTEASSIILDAPSTFECSGNYRKQSHPRPGLRRLAELYHPEQIAEGRSISREVPIDIASIEAESVIGISEDCTPMQWEL